MLFNRRKFTRKTTDADETNRKEVKTIGGAKVMGGVRTATA